MKPIKKIAVIHDICSVGKAALTNIIPVLSVMGIEVCPIPTYLLSAHTGGYGKPVMYPISNFIRDCANHYKIENISFDAILIGYLGTKEAIEAAVYFAEQFKNTKIILDPIFGDNGVLYSNFKEDYVSELKQLIPFADVILPNYTEAYYLIKKEKDENVQERTWEQLGKELLKLGAKNIVVTSIPAKQKENIQIGYGNEKERKIRTWKKEKQAYHGTGDIFAAVFSGMYLQTDNLEKCVESAHEFVSYCIKISSQYDYAEREGVLLEKCLSYFFVNLEKEDGQMM